MTMVWKTKSFSKLSDDELDKVVRGYICEHGATSGQVYLTGFLRSLGLQVSSLVPQLTIKGLNVFGERCTNAFVTFLSILFMLYNHQGFSMWRIRFRSLYCIPFSSPE